MPLKLDLLPDASREAFLLLMEAPELNNAILLGGTALTIQIGHRISEDLDFVFTSETLPRKMLEAFMAKINQSGLSQQGAPCQMQGSPNFVLIVVPI
ncbi:MAG: nucleotidyl transferase AbiEii/AbiGii toxin family protein [Proteobacteria bacterium]|nr:nucleotidyl transferase AbiEii/AbiGii toxin family protein [Pseudomonadota bacterium]